MCYNKGTKILILKNNVEKYIEEKYIEFEHLKLGDTAKTYKH
jgi:hypothetical protein